MTGMGNAPQGAPPRVLVVEDDQSVRRMLRFSLRTTGYSVTEVTTGMEAIRVLEQQPTDAVVLDLSLPDGLGGEVLWRLHQLAEQPRGLPVWVVISALDRNEAAARFGPLGSYFMAKPFDPWDLVRTLEVLLGAMRGEGRA